MFCQETQIYEQLIGILQYRKRVMTGEVAIRTREILRQIAMEQEFEIITGKVASDHVHRFIGYRPTQTISKIVQWRKGISLRLLLSEFKH